MEISATLDLRCRGLITVQYTKEAGTVIVEHVETHLFVGEGLYNKRAAGTCSLGVRSYSTGMVLVELILSVYCPPGSSFTIKDGSCPA